VTSPILLINIIIINIIKHVIITITVV